MGRLRTIDALRGIAAIFVLFGHSATFLDFDYTPRFWLAVDLFFLISGYILGGIYEPRFRAGMTMRAFLAARLRRLYPLYLLGMAIGIAGAGIALVLGKGKLSGVEFGLASLSGLAMLPSPTWAAEDSLFPLNFPAWSLFFELCANLVFVMLWRWLRLPLLIAIILLSALGVVLAPHSGAGEAWSSIGWGFPRVGFSFFAGVLLQRLPRPALGPSPAAWWLGAAVILLLAIAPTDARLLDSLTVLFAFPLIVWLAGAVEPSRPGLAAALGAMSYPVYIIHVPLLAIVTRLFILAGRDTQSAAPWLGFVLIAALCLFGLWLDRLFDGPVRRRIEKRRLSPGV